MASLNILYSDPHNFLKEVTKKLTKYMRKFLFGTSKILKNISWPINICLKYFMASVHSLNHCTIARSNQRSPRAS